MEKDTKKIVLVNSNYILKEIINNPTALKVTQLFKRLKDKYGDCIHTSNEIEIARELTGRLPDFLDKSEKYTLPFTDYQIISDALSKGESCILFLFSIPQLLTFNFDFKDNLDNLYVCNESLEEVKLKDYLATIDYKVSQMQSLDNLSNKVFEIEYKNNIVKKKCITKDDVLSTTSGDFSNLKLVPEGNHNEIILKVLNNVSTKYNVSAFDRLVELSCNSTLSKNIKEIFPNFLVYLNGSCVGYGYDTLPNNNVKTLKEYLIVKNNSDNSEATFKDLLQIAKKFLCVAKIFQSYNIYFYNMDLDDFKIILDNNGNVQNILPINCENLCIDGITTNDNVNKISQVDSFSKRYDDNSLQSYFYDNFLLYMVLKIVTLDIKKDYELLKNSINRLKFSSVKSISEAFEKVSWKFFDELGEIFIENNGHFSIYNMINVLNSCTISKSPLFNKATKKDLFHISIGLSLLCLTLLIVVLILIL